jgi:hypothetical protein
MMAIIASAVALVLLIPAAYSAGVALASDHVRSPTLTDLLMVGGLWAAAVLARVHLSWWLILMFVLPAAGFLGAGRTRLRTGHAPFTADPLAPQLAGWRALAMRLGDHQARLLLTIFYFSVLAPFGIGYRVMERRRVVPAHRYWADREQVVDKLSRAREQF